MEECKEIFFEILDLIRDGERKKREVKERIAYLRLGQILPSSNNDGMPRGSGAGDLSDYMASLDSMTRRYGEIRKVVQEARWEVRRAARDAGDEGGLIDRRYLQRQPRERTMKELGISKRKYYALCDDIINRMDIGEDYVIRLRRKLCGTEKRGREASYSGLDEGVEENYISD